MQNKAPCRFPPPIPTDSHSIPTARPTSALIPCAVVGRSKGLRPIIYSPSLAELCREFYYGSSMRWFDVKSALANYQAQTIDVSARPAAVLVLFEAQEPLHLVLTKRAATLRQHAGQISFPGGAVDAGDESIVYTALRECQEELGIEPKSVEVIGRLRDFHVAVSGYKVTPIVGRLREPVEYHLNPHEVDRVVRVPLDRALNRHNWDSMLRQRDGVDFRLPTLDIGEDRIWGATAIMLQHFAESLLPVAA